jgi:urease accessory protein UreE
MLIQAPTANIFDPALSTPPTDIDWLDLTWQECRRRAHRKKTRRGHDIRILLPLQQTLHHGDLLAQNPDGASIVINLLETALLVASPRTQKESLRLVFELGNLHVPVEFSPPAHLKTPHDEAVESLLSQLSIPFEIQTLRFQPDFWPDGVRLSDDFKIARS